MKILVVDDERPIRNSLKEVLEDEGHQVIVAEDAATALRYVGEITFDTIFSDVKMPGMDGIELLGKFQEMQIEAPVIIISGHGNIETAVECIRKGAYDFIEKPLDLNRLLITLRNANDKTSLTKEIKTLKTKVPKIEMVGQSPAMQRIQDIIQKVAPTDARVLIQGANGTGKELVARKLHENSPRAAMPFIEVNCAAIPGELIESELFGHEKGAFTSAVKQHKGKFEQAEGGTLFLDEVGDMSLAAQAKVLRVLQENKITRVGSNKDIDVHVRVLAATNKDLAKEIELGNFREDLYHRLSVIVVHVPSLAERREDIPLLVRYFIKQICASYGKAPMPISEEAVAQLMQQPWTGNIRELRNVVERLIILCTKSIEKADVIAYASPFFQ